MSTQWGIPRLFVANFGAIELGPAIFALVTAGALVPAAAGQVSSYVGQQLNNPTGTLTFTWPSSSGPLTNYNEAGLYVTCNGYGQGQGCQCYPTGGCCCVPHGFSRGGWYYPSGATQLVRIRRVDGGGLAAVEFFAGDPWNGCLGGGDGFTHLWVLAYAGGLILNSFDIDVPTGTWVGFDGSFDELRVGAYVNTYVRDLHDQNQVNAASFDTLRFLNSNCPGATTPPVDQISCTDGTFNFSIAAGGDPPLSYQWQWLPSNAAPDGWINVVDGANSNPGSTSFTASGSQTPNLTRSGTGGTGSNTTYANYRCVVSNSSCSVETYGALLAIRPPHPAIATQPPNTTACSSTWATITVEPAVTTTDPGPFTYQWQVKVPQENWKNIQDGDVDGDQYGLLGTAAYTTQQTLYFYPQPNDPTLQFRVTVGNPCGTLLSNAATFAVCDRFGDLDCNGLVDLSDIAEVLSEYGCTGYCYADVNYDGQVDLTDVALTLSNYGKPCP